MQNEVLAHKFVEHKVDDKINLTDNPKEFLKEKYLERFSFGLDSLQESGFYKLLGWAYNFRPYLSKFVYKRYGCWSECYAPNKTLLRKSLFGRIDQIIKIN